MNRVAAFQMKLTFLEKPIAIQKRKTRLIIQGLLLDVIGHAY